MVTEITFPEFAEDGDEVAKLLKWNYQIGEQVNEGEEVLELLTDKATFTVSSPVNGKLSKLIVEEGAEVKVGDVLGLIES